MTEPVIQRKKKVFPVTEGKATESAVSTPENDSTFESTQPPGTAKTLSNKPQSRDKTGKNRKRTPGKFKKAIKPLLKHWPELFSVTEMKPLEVGILRKMVQEGKVSESRLRQALTAYCNSFQYYKTVMRSEFRYGLDGKPSGKITDSEKAHAEGQLAHALEKTKKANEKKKMAESNR